MTPAPWSTQPVTGAQHDAWMAEERPALAYCPRGRRPYGYRWCGTGGWQTNDDYQVLMLMVDLRNQGKGYAAIAKELTRIGHTTPQGGKRWYAASVRRVLLYDLSKREVLHP